MVWYLAEKADVKPKSLGISGAGIHVVSHKQYQFQKLAEALTLLHFLTCKSDIHDVRTDVVYLLLECEFE